MSTRKISRWLLWRELLNGELLLIFLALWLAVTFSSGIALFADRLHKGLTAQSADLLGGDLIIKSSQPLDERWRQQAHRLGLLSSQSVEFSSMALAGDAMQLVAVKAVDSNYPLRGKLTLSQTKALSGNKSAVLQHGEIWVDKRLWQTFDPEKTAMISLGALDFQVTRTIESEPDRGAEFFNFSPRVIIPLNDLAATQLISVGSRASWKLALAGENSAIEQFADWLKPQLSPHEQLIGVNNQRPVVQNTLIKAEKYLYLSGLLAVVLAGVAIGFSMRRYTQRQTDGIALMKTLGADSQTIRRILIQKFLLLSLIAISLGVACGGAIQFFIIELLKQNLPANLPLPDSRPYWLACCTALLLIAGFAIPPLSHLIRTPAMRILKQTLPPITPKQALLYASAALSLWLLMALYSRDLSLGSIVFLGLLLLFVLLSALTLLTIRLTGVTLRKALFRYPASTLA
ncbi:MAG TPA: FtsX-like permease family protein, partial [Pseudomonadales bacterium]|nr:FtsX-like permease family protein [Pseudomonadales bacterium]